MMKQIMSKSIKRKSVDLKEIIKNDVGKVNAHFLTIGCCWIIMRL